jgi:hypothetical protein
LNKLKELNFMIKRLIDHPFLMTAVAALFSAQIAAADAQLPVDALLQLLNLNQSTDFTGSVSGDTSSACYLRMSAQCQSQQFIMINFPVNQGLSIDSSSALTINSGGQQLTIDSVATNPATLPGLGLQVGNTSENIQMSFTVSGTQLHVDASKTVSGFTLGAPGVSVSCDFDLSASH